MVIIRIERINDNKIKVEINSEDSKVWNVSLKNLTDNTPEAQNLFRHALKQAQEKLNFSIGSSQLVVEAIPLATEGFIMIISKVNYKSHLNTVLNLKTKDFKLKKDSDTNTPVGVYKFHNFDDLCDAAEEIFELFYGKSIVYKYNENYYLALLPNDMFGFYETDNKLSEFSDKVKNPMAVLGMLSEHGLAMIPTDAIDTLSRYFK